MLSRVKLLSLGRTQANDASCFRRGNGQNASAANKRAKRHTSRIIRRALKKELMRMW